MELVYCPACEGFSAPGSKVCEQCKAPIPEDAEPVQTIRAAPAAPEPPPPEEEEAPPEEAPAFPPLEGPPELLAKVEALEAAIEKEPSSKTPYLQLSQAYADAKRLDLAAATLERFLVVDPNNAYVKHRLSQVVAKRDAPAPGATAQATPPKPAAAAPRKAPATLPPQKAYSAAGLAQRPSAPVIRREFQGVSKQRKQQIAAAVGVVVLAVLVKMYVFPGTRRLVGGEFRAYAPAFSPTGSHIAFLIDDGQAQRLAVYDMRKKAHTPLAPVSGEGFAWSPDGTRIAYTASGSGEDWRSSVSVVDVATGQARKVASGHSPVWSGSSTLIIVCSPEPRQRESFSDDEPVSFSESDWGERFCRAEVATGSVQRTSLAPDYRMAVSGSVDSVVYEQVRDDASAPIDESPKKEFEQLLDRVTAGNAKNFAEGSRDLNRELEAKKYQDRRRSLGKTQKLPYEADVVVAGLDGGTPTLVTSGGRSGFPSWTHDGRVLYATNGAAGLELWSMTAQGGDKKVVLRGAKLEDPALVQLTRDGRRIFFVSPVEGDPGLAKMMTGEEPADIHYASVGDGKPTRLANQHPFKHRYSVSPNGNLVAYEVLQDIKLLGGAQRSEIWLVRR